VLSQSDYAGVFDGGFTIYGLRITASRKPETLNRNPCWSPPLSIERYPMPNLPHFYPRLMSSLSFNWFSRALVGGGLVMVLALGAGCSTSEANPDINATAPGPAPQDSPEGTSRATEHQNLAQELPISAVTILGGEEIFLEVAATPQQQSLGLMYRDPLPDDRGMVFPMAFPRRVSFWMKNVPVPLDMVFIYEGTIQAIASEVPPCTADPCPTYGPEDQLIDHVIELRAGRAAELGLAVGDPVEIQPLER